MSNTIALTEHTALIADQLKLVGSAIAGNLPDSMFWGAITPNVAGQAAIPQVGEDIVSLARQSRSEIESTVEEYPVENINEAFRQRESIFKRAKNGAYLGALAIYTTADDALTAPAWQALDSAVDDSGVSEVAKHAISGGGLVALSASMAMGMSILARKFRKPVAVEEQMTQKNKDYELTYAVGVPLRVHLGEITNSFDMLKHSLAYATVGQAVLYQTLDGIGKLAGAGDSNAIFYTGLLTFIAAKYTEDLYPRSRTIDAFKTIVNPLRLVSGIKNAYSKRKSDSMSESGPIPPSPNVVSKAA